MAPPRQKVAKAGPSDRGPACVVFHRRCASETPAEVGTQELQAVPHEVMAWHTLAIGTVEMGAESESLLGALEALELVELSQSHPPVTKINL